MSEQGIFAGEVRTIARPQPGEIWLRDADEVLCRSHTWKGSTVPDSQGGEAAVVLPIGTPVRHRRHRNLTGRIATHEYNQYGDLSPIPYGIAWDSPSYAFDCLGMFACYGSPESVEAMSDV